MICFSNLTGSFTTKVSPSSDQVEMDGSHVSIMWYVSDDESPGEHGHTYREKKKKRETNKQQASVRYYYKGASMQVSCLCQSLIVRCTPWSPEHRTQVLRSEGCHFLDAFRQTFSCTDDPVQILRGNNPRDRSIDRSIDPNKQTTHSLLKKMGMSCA